jgi:hypothetical protein
LFRRSKSKENGTTLTTNTATAVDINLTSTGADLGGTDEGSTWNARLGGFIVYNRGLSDDEITITVNALKSRYLP